MKPQNDPKGKGLLRPILTGLIVVVLLTAAAAVFFIIRPFSPKEVATLGNEKISVAEFKVYLAFVKERFTDEYKRQSPNTDTNSLWNTNIGGKNALEVAKEKAMDMAKETKVQLIKAKEEKLTLEKSDLDEIDKNLSSLGASLKEQGSTQTPGAFIKTTYGITLDEFKEVLKENALVNKFRVKQTSDIKVGEQDINDYYAKIPLFLQTARTERMVMRLYGFGIS